MKFEYTLTDDELAGVSKSLEAHNNAKPQEIDNPDHVPSQGSPTMPDPENEGEEIANPDFVEAVGEPKIPNPDLIADEDAYLNFVFSECFKSYQKQFELDG
tara:strand:+ start:1561 stop:1863 length:303 start_codon:yes stop_codon:yes gene_type:complete